MKRDTLCDGCGTIIRQTAGRGAPRKYCEGCRPVQVQRGRVHGWEVNRMALANACRVLGIEKPVHVKRSCGQNLRGAHHGVVTTASGKLHRFCDPTISHHAITIAANSTPEEASMTLWHELAHAMQCERDPRHKTRYSRYMKDNGGKKRAYWNCPWEVEARATEGMHDEVGSLIVQTGPDSGWRAFDIDDHREVIAEARKQMDEGVRNIIARLESE